MLRDHVRLLVARRRHAANDARVARRDAVVDVRLGQLLLQQVEERQEHRAHRPEKVRERQIFVLLAIDAHDHIEEVARHEDGERRLPAPVGEDFQQPLERDVALTAHKLVERLAIVVRQDALKHIGSAQGEDLVEEHLLDADAVRGQLELELAAILHLRADGVDDELMLGKPLHEHLNPRGHAAYDVGIRTFRQQTDAHHFSPFQ